MTLAQARAQGITPKKGGTLNTILTPEPPILVLGVNWQGPTQIAASKIYQGLLTYTEDLKPQPNLAKSWTISDDKLVYTFHLQENVKWHDGQPFTADDVIFSIMKWHTELTPRSKPIFGNIKQAKALDPHTVELTLAQAFEPFILMFDTLAANMVPKHIYEGTEFRTNPANQKPIGTGPFQFVEWQRGSFIHLKRFEGYWKPGQPYLDEIIYKIIPDSQSRALALADRPGAADAGQRHRAVRRAAVSRHVQSGGRIQRLGVQFPAFLDRDQPSGSSRSTTSGCARR